MLGYIIISMSGLQIQLYCQTPVQVFGLGVDFVLPLSQQEQQQQEPHQNLPEGSVLEV